MSRILYQMNSAAAPAARRAEPVRQIGNYFFLLTTMMKLGLQLIWERKNGLKYFEGIADNTRARELYDDIIRCIMRPEEEDSPYFQPEEIDAVAEKLSTRGIKTSEVLDYLKKIIAAKLDSQDLQSDGDTHRPTIGWNTPKPHEHDTLEFQDDPHGLMLGD